MRCLRPGQLGADDGGREHDFVALRWRDNRFAVGRWPRGKSWHVERVGATLQVRRDHARSDRACDDERLVEHGRGARRHSPRANVRDDLARLEAHRAARRAQCNELCGHFDVIASEDRRQEFDVIVGAKETLVAIETDEKLRGDIAEEPQDARPVDELAGVMGIVRAHAQPQRDLGADHDEGKTYHGGCYCVGRVLAIGSLVAGKYRLVRLLGDGGMGSVYEAQHSGLGTLVAIKVLHPDLARRAGLVERFLQEARVAAQIRCPHVVQVTDVDRTPEGQAYIVMELLEGEPLSSVIERQRKVPIDTACEYALQILAALEAAHSIGVIHRDLKPENVFVTFAAGRPVLKLIDFGIAKARRTDPQQKGLTVAGVVMGTAEYMAPEQARSADQVDVRADIYAAGVMLYEMIAGSRPVAGDDARVIALKVERGEIVPLVQVAPEVPREIAGLVHRAMAARPELRFASATDMRLALEKARRSAGALSVPGVPAKRPDDRVGAATGRELPSKPAVHTLRAPPIPTALAAAAYGAAPPPAMAPGAYGGVPPMPAAPAGRAHRRGRGPIVALLALLILFGGGLIATFLATGTGASVPEPAAPVRARVDPRPAETAAAATTQVPTAPQAQATSDVPALAPTRPVSLPAAAPRAAPSGRPKAAPTDDSGAPDVPPFFLPSTFPSVLPPFPSVLPPFPSGLPFPKGLPSGFPSVLPQWPPPPG